MVVVDGGVGGEFFYDVDVCFEIEYGFGMDLCEEGFVVGEDVELEEVDVDGVEGIGGFEGFEVGGVVGVDEELVEFEVGVVGEGGEEVVVLFGGEGGVVVGVGKVCEYVGEFYVFGGVDFGIEFFGFFVLDVEVVYVGVDF